MKTRGRVRRAVTPGGTVFKRAIPVMLACLFLGPGAMAKGFLIGASLMGFGSMLAGGCAVGAGVSGGAVLVVTAWVALFCMWLGAGVTDYLVDRKADDARIACDALQRESEAAA